RLSLREDNADLRLTQLGRNMGLVPDERWDAFNRKRDQIETELQRLKSTWVNPRTLSRESAISLLGRPIEREYSLNDILRRPEVRYDDLMRFRQEDGSLLAGPGLLDVASAEQVEIQVKYAGYVERQKEDVE